MKQPLLNEIPIEEGLAGILSGAARLSVTMSPGQWDTLLQCAYDLGATVLEMDANEQPVRAYRKALNFGHSLGTGRI